MEDLKDASPPVISLRTVALWVVAAAAFGAISMLVLVPLGPIRSTATQIPGIVAAWFLGRRYAWIPTVAAMTMIPVLSPHPFQGPVQALSYFLSCSLAIGLVTSIGWLSDLNRDLAKEVRHRRKAEESLQDLNANLESRIKEATFDLSQAHTQLQVKADELESTVRKRTADLQDTIEDLEWMIAVISHDVRAPIRHIQSYAEIIQDSRALGSAPEEQHALNRIQVRARDASSLIESLLTVSRSRFTPPKLVTTDVRAIILGLLEKPQIDASVEDDLPTCAAAPALCREVFSNLLDNAFKHGAPPIKISATRENGLVHYFVEDAGTSQKPDQELAEFQPNLGLLIVRKHVERMGGNFDISSTPTGHTVARVSLREKPLPTNAVVSVSETTINR